MDNLSARLRNKVDFYGRTLIKNELGETDCIYKEIKPVWGELTPKSGNVRDGPSDTKYADISHKLTIRTNSIKLSNDMYFIYKGLKYDIKFYYPNFKFNNSIDIFCELVVE